MNLSDVDVARIADVFADQAAAADDPEHYLRDVIRSAGLPFRWQLQALGHVRGDVGRTCRNVVRWATAKGRNPQSPDCTALGSLLWHLLADVGPDLAAEVVATMLVHELVVNAARTDLVRRFQAPVAEPAADVYHPPGLELQPGDLELQGLRPAPLLLDVGFLAGAIRRSASVCRVETLAGAALGSGCLVAGDLVLTSRHVVPASREPLLVRLRCTSSAQGVTIPLDRDHPVPLDGGPDGLDFAMLRLVRPVGTDDGVTPLTLADAPVPVRGDKLSILQHPDGGPMQLATTVNAVDRTDEAAGTIRYRTQTAGGSSGAPCFDEAWRLVAIHRAERATAFGAVREGVLVRSLPRSVTDLLTSGRTR